MLDNLRSVHNVGSIFRTAEAAGFTAVFCCGTTPTPLDHFGRPRRDFTKVALGAEQHLPWFHRVSTARLLRTLKKRGYTIVAVEQDKRSISYRQFHPKSGARLVLVVGNELGGVVDAARNFADHILEIPMRGEKESLNVAVAFGIVAFALSQHSLKIDKLTAGIPTKPK